MRFQNEKRPWRSFISTFLFLFPIVSPFYLWLFPPPMLQILSFPTSSGTPLLCIHLLPLTQAPTILKQTLPPFAQLSPILFPLYSQRCWQNCLHLLSPICLPPTLHSAHHSLISGPVIPLTCVPKLNWHFSFLVILDVSTACGIVDHCLLHGKHSSYGFREILRLFLLIHLFCRLTLLCPVIQCRYSSRLSSHYFLLGQSSLSSQLQRSICQCFLIFYSQSRPIL